MAKENKRTRGQAKIEFNDPSRTVTDPTSVSPLQAVLRGGRGEYVPGHGRNPLPAGDYSNFPLDLGSALTLVKTAQESFDRLPALIRQRFGNNPGELSAFMALAATDETARNEAIRLGLLPKPPKTPSPEPTVPPTDPSISAPPQ